MKYITPPFQGALYQLTLTQSPGKRKFLWFFVLALKVAQGDVLAISLNCIGGENAKHRKSQRKDKVRINKKLEEHQQGWEYKIRKVKNGIVNKISSNYLSRAQAKGRW